MSKFINSWGLFNRLKLVENQGIHENQNWDLNDYSDLFRKSVFNRDYL